MLIKREHCIRTVTSETQKHTDNYTNLKNNGAKAFLYKL